ncbi:MAG: lipase maturation factor family protein, partial [Phycisphaerae bacterium]
MSDAKDDQQQTGVNESEPVRESQAPAIGSFYLARFLFLKAMAVIYAIAFASLSVQIVGLVGENGIQPIQDYLNAARDFGGFRDYGFLPEFAKPLWNVPTIFWIDASDATLKGACVAGMVLAGLLFLGVCPPLMLLLLWANYLSLSVAGQVFLQFQWDSLLLETGLVAVFFAPWVLWAAPKRVPPPPVLPRWLLIWILFRLMMSSGLVKLIHDHPLEPTWRNLTALGYHYETQCIPNAMAWFAHQAPPWVGAVSTAMMFFIEIATPLFFFFPRRLRHLAGLSQILLQLVIIATGNYTYFNWLTIALCLVLFDDRFLSSFLPRQLRSGWNDQTLPAVKSTAAAGRIRRGMVTLFGVTAGAASFAGGGIEMAKRVWPRTVETPMPDFVMNSTRWLSPFRSLNNYGLFTRMTTVRYEIEIQGSTDGVEWRPYVLPYQPGPVDRMPPFVAPHQPRLDWQMWFAALRHPSRRPRWFDQFLGRLLDGEPSVIALLAEDPFPEMPPAYIRAVRYRYRFSDWETGRRTGDWWTRDYVGPYGPVRHR